MQKNTCDVLLSRPKPSGMPNILPILNTSTECYKETKKGNDLSTICGDNQQKVKKNLDKTKLSVIYWPQRKVQAKNTEEPMRIFKINEEWGTAINEVANA